jgi:hypothetical protein
MLKILTISLFAVALWAGEAELDRSPIDKVLDSNLVSANKAFSAYQAEVAKAMDKTVKDLEKLKADAMKKGNLPLANAVDAEITKVKEGSLAERVEVKAKEKDDLMGDAPIGSRKVTIAASTDGQVIATLKKGQTVTLQYVEGVWGDGGNMKGSPDTEATGKTCRMQLVTTSGIVDVPTNTIKSPFKYKATEDGEVSVRMVDSVRRDNTGSVVYMVAVSK